MQLTKYINKFIYLSKAFKQKPFKLLDVGSGNHSASKTKTVFPNCSYSGIDLERDYNNSDLDYKLMDNFYELDLTKLQFDKIPDNYFDAINMVHIIEHLHNGEEVIIELSKKLKQGGYIYLEYPGIKSTKLPSMRGTLNFYDDKTHVKVYNHEQLTMLLNDHGFTVLKHGIRRNIYFILAMPFRILATIFSSKKMEGNIFWDILGFAEYVWAIKK